MGTERNGAAGLDQKAARYAAFEKHTAPMPRLKATPESEPLFRWPPNELAVLDASAEPPTPEHIVHTLRSSMVNCLRLQPLSLGVICMSELITNAVMHNNLQGVEVWEGEDGELICKVYDAGEAGRRHVDRALEVGGLGLEIVGVTTDLYGRTEDNVSWCAFQPEYQEAA
jgi:hypothetical protein